MLTALDAITNEPAAAFRRWDIAQSVLGMTRGELAAASRLHPMAGARDSSVMP
jgi:hypothetical protein